MQNAPRNNRLIIWAALATLAAIAVVVVAVSAVGSSPKICARCHVAQSQSLASAPHAALSCYACHLEQGAWSLPGAKAREFGAMYPAALLGRGVSGPARLTSAEACLHCHQDIMTRVSQSAGLRIQHSTCAAGATCDSCHSTVAHGPSVRWRQAPAMEQCIECHQARKAPTTCPTCHVSKVSAEKLSVRVPWQVTHGSQWQSTHGMGNLSSCSTCHPSDYCARCHQVTMPHPGDFGATHGELAMQNRAACMACHKTSAFCDGCHQIQMPHPSGFLQNHKAAAKNMNDPSCLRCHVANDCQNCHVKHVHPGGSKGAPWLKGRTS